MKTIFKKIGLSLAAFVCAVSAGAGVALTVPQTTEANAATVTLEDRNYYISGTGVRLVNDKNGAGLRFHTNLLASEYAKVEESGTLIIPEFRYDGELTLDDLNKDAKNRPTHIVTKGTVNGQEVNYWKDHTVDGEAFKRATVYLHDIPEVGYGTRMVVVSYVKIDGQYVYTSVIDGSNYISMSSVASALKQTASAEDKARLEAFLVDDVTVTFVMPDGSKTTQTVAYGSKLTAPTLNYSADWYNVAWKDQYGKAWDFDYSQATYPATLTATFTAVDEVKQVASKALGDCYGADSVERAWVNGSTPEVLKTGVPVGFNVLNKFTWFKDSNSIWKINHNPLYRACYDDTDLSGYEKVRFMLKLETTGDAYVTFSNKGQVIRNEWLTFELTQNTPGVWSLKVFNEGGEVVHQVDNYSRFEGSNDSIRALVFPTAWTNALGHTFATKLMPATTKDHDIFVYTTEILGYRSKNVSVYPTVNTTEIWGHIWNNYYFEGGGQPEGAWSDEAAPVGFNKVSEYTWTSTTSNDFNKVSHFNDTDISAYSDVYFAMKVENGMDIYIQGASSFYKGNDWLYVHMYQAEDGTWSKDFMIADGSYSVLGVQTGLVGTKLTQIMNWVSGINTGSYPRLDSTVGATATAYFTEVRGVLKDASVPEEVAGPMDIPEEAMAARAYIWRDDLYTTGKMTLTTEGAPAGFTTVIAHNWSGKFTAEYTYCFDESLNISLYSDLYFAMKLENGSHFYVRNSSAGHYTGGNWLYAHYSKNADGTWTMNVEAVDGYKAYSKQNYTATTLKGLLEGNLYAFSGDKSLPTIAYYTEVRAIAEDGIWGERAVWSAVDRVVNGGDLAVGMPIGFTSVYKKANMTVDDFATLDLSDGYYNQIKFGLISDQNINVKSPYGYVPEGETAARATVVNSKTTENWYTMNVFTLTNLGNNNWKVEMTGRIYYGSATVNGVSMPSGRVAGTFTYTISGTTLKQILSTIYSFPSNSTIYCTEVRGTHTHKASKTVSLGNGYTQDYCACGLTMGEPVAFAHGIPAEATMILPSIWRDDNHALSKTTTMAVPAGFTNVKEYDWLHNTAGTNGAAWGTGDTNMSTYCINETDISGYSDVYFAIRIVGGKDIYIRGLGDNATYAGGDWLYVHYQQTSAEVWTLSVASVDGYKYVKTGVTGNNLKTLMSWTATNNSLFPRRNADDVAPMIYFTDVRAIKAGCEEHAVASYASNGNGTHNALCQCGEVLDVNVTCAGGSATCEAAAVCSLCDAAYGEALGHNFDWVLGQEKCTVCGNVAGTASVLPFGPFEENTPAFVNNADLNGVTAPEGFSTVTRKDASTGWTSSDLSARYFSKKSLSMYSEVWFALKVVNGRFVFANIANDYSKGSWVYFHLTKLADSQWKIEATIDGEVYATIENQSGAYINGNQPANSLAAMFYDGGWGSADGNAVLIYYSTNGTLTTVYTTEILGVVDPGISGHATKVRESIWRNNNYALSASTDMAVPAGFTNVKEYKWNLNTTLSNGIPWGSAQKDFPLTCLDEALVAGYSEIYFAMKNVNGTGFYVRGGTSYTGSDWLYYHYKKAEDGTWSLSLHSLDGYEAINVQKGIQGTSLKDLMNYGSYGNGCYPTKTDKDTTTDVRIYMTDMWAVAEGTEHAAYTTISNGDGTHSVLCSCGDTLEVANCYGGTATCSLPSICAACNTAYGAKAEHEGEWIENQYVCGNCGVALGNIQTELDKQTVALFTNATAIAANQTTTATLDLSTVTSLPMTLKSVELDSVTYNATMVGTKVNLTVLPKTCFGEYLATVTVLIDGQEFEISVPVLVVTNLITTNAGMQSMRVVLRGADTEADENGSIGGKGGVDTMQGDGYYMLGGNITLTKGTYVYGTSYVPFVGTFDGDGYSVSGYGWADWYGSNQQDISASHFGNYLEGSLFGVVDGHVKNVAFTNCKFGIFENIMHSGNGLFEDCYIEVLDMNSNANMYTPCIFARQEAYGTGTLRNCVIDYSNFNSPILDAAINTAEIDDLTPNGTNAENVGTRYMSAAGKIYNGENVLVVNFNKKYISVKSGRGNIYTDRAGNHTDGAEAGIRAEYTDGTNNGAWYSYASLNSKLWKMVNGIPYLIKMNVSGTASAPSATSPEQNKNELDGYVTNNGTTQYYIAWESSTGALKSAKFINDTMKTSTGATLATGAIDSDNLWKKQIVLGSYANYGDKISGLDMSTLADDSYGIYLVEKTFFILSDSDEAMVIAAEEFCRRIFGWTEIAPNQFIYDMEATVAIPAKLNYTSEIVFDVRSAAFTKDYSEKHTMNFVSASPYTSYSAMHNALDYFANYTGDMTNMLNVNSETDEKGNGTEIHGEQLCYTARGNKTSFDAMVGQVVNEIVNLAMEKPSMTAVNFMIEDDPDYCGCSECKKFSNPSIPQLIFLNELAYRLNSHEYMRTAGRTIAIEFFAYSSFYHAPIMTANDITALNSLKSTLGLKATNALGTFTYKDMNTAGANYAEANDNTTTHTILKSDGLLRLWWTSHKASHAYALSHKANDHMYLPLLAWTACVGAQNIDVFMYQTSFWDLQLPLNTWEYQLIWYQELNKLGIGSYMFNLGNSYNKAEAQTAFHAFKAYIDSRAMTDLNVTFEQLKDEFFSTNGYYGKAGPQMRVFFEELVSALERKKQDGDNSILSDNGDTTTEYVDASEFRYYALDKDGNPLKSGEETSNNVAKPATPYYWRIQAFFNGVYGLSEGSLLFKQKDGSHNTVTGVGKNTSVTIALEKAAHAYELYMYGGKSQIETLKAWQQYCVTALNTAGLTETQKKHIKMEAVFPEYAMLLLYTDYSVTFTRTNDKADTWTKKDGVTCTLQSVAANVTSVSGATLTYQSLYNLMKNELGIETPSEQYSYEGKNSSGSAITIGAGWMNMTFIDTNGSLGIFEKTLTVGITLSNVLSHSAFKNWGVV